MRIERFEDIEAWQLARELARKVYGLTKKAKFARDFGLKGQIQNAAGSSMHNIAEGFDSETNPEFVHFLIDFQINSFILLISLSPGGRGSG